MILRRATVNDIPLLIKVRIDFLIEYNGNLTPDEKTAIRKQLEAYFNKHIPLNSFIAVIAEEDGYVLSAAYLVISEKPANPSCLTGITGTILNVLTYSKYRRKGIAAKVIKKTIDEAKQLGVSSIDLSATDDGKPLYEKIGFRTSNNTAMRMKLL